MRELLRFDCIVNGLDNISFHQDKMYEDEMEIRIYDGYKEEEFAVVLSKEQIKEVIRTLTNIL